MMPERAEDIKARDAGIPRVMFIGTCRVHDPENVLRKTKEVYSRTIIHRFHTPKQTLQFVRHMSGDTQYTPSTAHHISNRAALDIFGRGSATKEEIEEAVKILEDSGSIDYARDLAISYINEGKAKLDILEDSEAKDVLLAIADYMISRKH